MLLAVTLANVADETRALAVDLRVTALRAITARHQRAPDEPALRRLLVAVDNARQL